MIAVRFKTQEAESIISKYQPLCGFSDSMVCGEMTSLLSTKTQADLASSAGCAKSSPSFSHTRQKMQIALTARIWLGRSKGIKQVQLRRLLHAWRRPVFKDKWLKASMELASTLSFVQKRGHLQSRAFRADDDASDQNETRF